ncbi:MAG: hypothetical protein FWF95_04255 [Syntrophorhabdaceae bacterium]|nr:hypothetical protein [Syntrophorhabdaceae bacterium]
MAHFYDEHGDPDATWEDVGGFNTHLLNELRNALISVDLQGSSSNPIQAVVAEWIKQLPAFDFPDDDIG